MRKFFTLICVALLSLAMQATVVTQEIALSDFTGNATVEGNVITAIDDSWQGVYKNDGYSAFALSESHYTELAVELSATPTAQVYVQVSYSDASSNDFSITTAQSSGRLALASANVTGIAIKLIAAGSATISKISLYKVIGKETESTLTEPEGGNAFGNWEHSIYCNSSSDAEKYAALREGDVLRINYTATATEGDWAQCMIQVLSTPRTTLSRTDASGYAFNVQDAAGDGVIDIHLSSEDIDGLKTNGMFMNGKNMTINKVSVAKYEQQVLVERTLNTGNEVLTWSALWEHTTDLPVLAENDEIRITVSAAEESDQNIWICYDWEETNHIKLSSITTTVPHVYTAVLTGAQASAINAANKLFLKGSNVTLSRFAIAQPQSIYDAAWRDEKTYDDSWSVNEVIAADKFAGLSVGDMISINISALENGGQVRLLHDWTPFAPEAVYVFNATHAAPMTVSFVVNQEMRDAILADGIRVRGVNFTMTEVYVLEAEARTESYTLTVSDAGLATLVLPFNVPTLPEGVKAYTLSNDGSAVIDAVEVSALRGDKPVLIIAEAGEYVLTSELGGNADISGKNHWPVSSYVNEALVGNYAPTLWVPSDGQPNGNNYILQNGAEGVGFYKVTGDPVCTLAPYRAYLSCGYNAMAAGAPMRIRFKHDVVTATENVAEEGNVQKLLRDGQLLIRRGENIYTIQGQIVK